MITDYGFLHRKIDRLQYSDDDIARMPSLIPSCNAGVLLPIGFELIIDQRPQWPLIDCDDNEYNDNDDDNEWRGLRSASSASPVWRIVGGTTTLPRNVV